MLVGGLYGGGGGGVPLYFTVLTTGVTISFTAAKPRH